MIDVVNIKNFKCFSEEKFEFTSMNILTGANASGKSTVIQAILLFFRTLQEKGKNIDVNYALGVQVGNPRFLISQNPIKTANYAFEVSIEELKKKTSIDYRIDGMSPLNLLYEGSYTKVKSKIFYLNAERIGPRMSYPAGGEEVIRADGSNAAYIVDQADMKNVQIPDNICTEVSKKFSAQVEGWMNIILGDVQLSVSTDIVKASTDIRYRNGIVDYEVLPTMTGFGISYIFPIIVLGLWCTTIEDAVFIIENPEAHLHPAAQSRMGKFLQLISDCGVQVIIETHSEHIIDGMRIEAAILNKTHLSRIYYFSKDNKKINIEKITVDEKGELSNWPECFFDQKGLDLRELLLLRRTNASK